MSQSRLIFDLNTGNLLISAGAGTGKTYTLVEHLLAALSDPHAPVEIDQVLAVTFTEAAAAEMKERIRSRLCEQISRTGSNQQRLLRQLLRLDLAKISTLHSFCYRLVLDHALELGIDPRFEVLEPSDAVAIRREVFDRCLDEAVAGRMDGWSEQLREGLVELLYRYHEADETRLFRLLNRLYDLAQSTAHPAAWLEAQERFWIRPDCGRLHTSAAPVIAAWWAQWREYLREQQAQNPKAAELLGIFGDRAPESIDAFISVCRAIQEADATWPARKKQLLRAPLRGIFDEVMRLLGEETTTGEELFQQLVDPSVRVPMQALFRILGEFRERYRLRKLVERAVEFSDLEQYTLDLLLGPNRDQLTGLAKDLSSRLRLIYVDEYQDINEAQDAILCALAGVEPSRRFGVVPGGPRRFLVGDVKQSIYAFRLTDPRIFQSYARHWRDGNESGTTHALSINYRSKPSILSFINSVFSHLFAQSGQDLFERSDHLQPARSEREAGEPAVEVWLVHADEEVGAHDPLDLEATWVARRIKLLLDEGYQIEERGGGICRPVTPDDICVLMRSPATMAQPFVHQLLRLGIRVSVNAESDWNRLEVTDLVALLRLLQNPLYDDAVLQVLRGPFVGLSAEELARIRVACRRGTLWQAVRQFVANAESELVKGFERLERLREFVRWYDRWRIAARSMRLGELVGFIIDQTGYAEYVEAQDQDGTGQAVLQRFLAEVERFQGPAVTALQRLLKNIELYQAEPVRAADAGLANNAVRVLSIHQSKGLEFPVVFVVGLGRSFNFEESQQRILTHVDWGVAPRQVEPESGWSRHTILSWLVQQQILQDRRAEELRLLYVAMTRARDLLVLTGLRGGSTRKRREVLGQNRPFHKAQSPLEWLMPLFGVAECGAEEERYQSIDVAEPRCRLVLVRGMPESGAEEAELLPDEAPAQADDRAAELPDGASGFPVYPYQASALYPAKLSVTGAVHGLGGLEDQDADVWTDRFDPSRWDGEECEAGARVGLVIHRVLQHLPFQRWKDESEISRCIYELVETGLLTEEEARLVDPADLLAFFRSDLADLFLREEIRLFRELRFTARFLPEELERMKLPGKTGPVEGSALFGFEDDFVVVQGVADLVGVVDGEGFYLLDYKTDRIDWGRLCEERLPTYMAQVRLYAEALKRIFKAPLRQAALYFIKHRRSVVMDHNFSPLVP